MQGKIQIHSILAPEAVGPYSQAVRAGGFVFVSGQIPLDPATGSVVAGGIKEQTARVLESIETILAEVKLGRENIVKCEIFMKDLSQFKEMNEVYASFFGGSGILPARQAVEVSRLPRDVLIEISCIALDESIENV